uniref:Uncharacterized protein n=1 Tax=Arundo donax TaxID=35708 RepID=A0A0A9HEP3_ARUDO
MMINFIILKYARCVRVAPSAQSLVQAGYIGNLVQGGRVAPGV